MDTLAVDRRVVTAQLAQVQSSLRRLGAIAQQPTDAYLADPDQFAIAEHHLRRALEAALDAGRHLIARLSFGAAADYADVPRRLQDGGVLTEATGSCLARCARLRNRLVYAYWQADAPELLRLLAQTAACLDAFCTEVAGFLAVPPGSAHGSA